jgi:hypothetical protein
MAPPATTRRWLLFVHQLPSTPSNLRVRTWRRLQHLGAIPLKQAVHVLPDGPGAREDFEWLKEEVKASGGDASVFVANHVDAWSDDALVTAFRRSGQEAYAALAADIEETLRRAATARRPKGTRAPAKGRLLKQFRERLSAIEAVDFFGSAGRDRVSAVLKQLEEQAAPPARAPGTAPSLTGADTQSYQGRLWVTRPRPGVDRMASAWLIRRFIDQQATFGFTADLHAVPSAGVPFDMFGVEFSHQGECCTFETLCSVFGVEEPAVARIATIVHDLDLKDGRFGAPEASAVSTLIEGLQLAHTDDDMLLAQGMAMFDALYRGFEHPSRASGPRPVVKARQRSASNASVRTASTPRIRRP